MDRMRTIVIVLAIILCFSIFVVCYRKNRDIALTTTDTGSNYTVYLITIDKMDQFWSYLDDGASTMAELLGINYIWEAPEQKNDARQIELIYEAVENGADLIMLAAGDPMSLNRAIEDAKALSVNVIYVDTPADEEAITTLATDNYSAGAIAGEAMIEELESLGIQTGSIGIIGVSTNTSSTLNRENGFRQTIEEDGRYILLNTVYMNGDPILSEEAATSFIINNPELVGMFGTNEGSTIGVGNAIMKNNTQMVGIGFDRTDRTMELIRNGSLDVVMAQNPFTMGYLGMAQAYAALSGLDTGPEQINTGISILRRRN